MANGVFQSGLVFKSLTSKPPVDPPARPGRERPWHWNWGRRDRGILRREPDALAAGQTSMQWSDGTVNCVMDA